MKNCKACKKKVLILRKGLCITCYRLKTGNSEGWHRTKKVRMKEQLAKNKPYLGVKDEKHK